MGSEMCIRDRNKLVKKLNNKLEIIVTFLALLEIRSPAAELSTTLSLIGLVSPSNTLFIKNAFS